MITLFLRNVFWSQKRKMTRNPTATGTTMVNRDKKNRVSFNWIRGFESVCTCLCACGKKNVINTKLNIIYLFLSVSIDVPHMLTDMKKGRKYAHTPNLHESVCILNKIYRKINSLPQQQQQQQNRCIVH